MTQLTPKSKRYSFFGSKKTATAVTLPDDATICETEVKVDAAPETVSTKEPTAPFAESTPVVTPVVTPEPGEEPIASEVPALDEESPVVEETLAEEVKKGKFSLFKKKSPKELLAECDTPVVVEEVAITETVEEITKPLDEALTPEAGDIEEISGGKAGEIIEDKKVGLFDRLKSLARPKKTESAQVVEKEAVLEEIKEEETAVLAIDDAATKDIEELVCEPVVLEKKAGMMDRLMKLRKSLDAKQVEVAAETAEIVEVHQVNIETTDVEAEAETSVLTKTDKKTKRFSFFPIRKAKIIEEVAIDSLPIESEEVAGSMVEAEVAEVKEIAAVEEVVGEISSPVIKAAEEKIEETIVVTSTEELKVEESEVATTPESEFEKPTAKKNKRFSSFFIKKKMIDMEEESIVVEEETMNLVSTPVASPEENTATIQTSDIAKKTSPITTLLKKMTLIRSSKETAATPIDGMEIVAPVDEATEVSKDTPSEEAVQAVESVLNALTKKAIVGEDIAEKI